MQNSKQSDFGREIEGNQAWLEVLSEKTNHPWKCFREGKRGMLAQWFRAVTGLEAHILSVHTFQKASSSKDFEQPMATSQTRAMNSRAQCLAMGGQTRAIISNAKCGMRRKSTRLEGSIEQSKLFSKVHELPTSTGYNNDMSAILLFGGIFFSKGMSAKGRLTGRL